MKDSRTRSTTTCSILQPPNSQLKYECVGGSSIVWTYEGSIVWALLYERSSMSGDKEHKSFDGGVFEAL